jgi:hypothetical protein
MPLAVLKLLYEAQKTNKYFSFNGKDGTLVQIMHVMERAVSSWQKNWKIVNSQV